jgi:hypothetical protein
MPIRRFDAEIANRLVTTSAATSASATLPDAVLGAGAAGRNLVVKVALLLPPAAHNSTFRVLLDSGSASQDAGAFAMFGHHIVTCPVTFTVPLSTAMTALRASNAPLNLRVVSELGPPPNVAMAHAAGQAAEVASIVVEAQ